MLLVIIGLYVYFQKFNDKWDSSGIIGFDKLLFSVCGWEYFFF